MGEMHFATTQKQGNFFLLHHGITTRLRLGDVSIFEFPNGKLTGIGELKSRKVADKELGLSIIIAPADKESVKRYAKIISFKNKSKKTNFNESLDKKTVNKLGRQLVKIDSSLKPSPPDKSLGQEVISNYDQFVTLLSSSRNKRVFVGLVGGSQTVVRYAIKGRTLSERLFSKANPLKQIDLEDIKNKAIESLVPNESQFNTLYSGYSFNPKSNNPLNHRIVPLFWRGINARILKELVFYKTQVLTILNMGHVFKAINDSGLEVTVLDGKPTAKSKDGRFQLGGFEYFMNLMIEGFYSDQSVINLINKWIKTIEEANYEADAKVTLDIREVSFNEAEKKN